jgi:hypothetical protein
VTFETQEGLERAIKYWDEQLNEKDEFKIKEFVEESDRSLCGEELYLTQPPEPSNIIWENLRVETKYDFFGKKAGKCCAPSIRRNNYIVLFLILCFISVMFIFFLWLKKKVTE